MDDKLDFIRENVTMSDNALGAELGLSSDQVFRLRKKHGISKDNTFERGLEDNGLPHNWKHGWLKTDNSSIFIRNKESIMTYNQVRDELISEMKKYAPRYKWSIPLKDKKGNLLVIDPADIHIGKLSVAEETGHNYNIEIAKKRCITAIDNIMFKAGKFGIDQIVLVVGNDIIHVDHPHRKTTAGTPQDTEGQWWQMFKEAKELYVQIIERLRMTAPVHIVFNPSNHDYSAGFMLADTLSSWFSKAKGVTFDVSIAHRKYYQYGKNLICTSHGDGAKEGDMPIIMASERPKEWADTKFRYIYLHHIHHKKQLKWQNGKDYHGATVEYLRTPSAPDGWHDRNGYTATPQAIEAFIHDKEYGQVARLTHYF